MSLIINEIYPLDGFRHSILVFAADRRISRNGSFVGNHRKLFRIPYFDGGISYFGLAEFTLSNGKRFRMWEFLPTFIDKHGGIRDLDQFAKSLREELNHAVPESVLSSTPSGFHICGYTAQGLPDFWSLVNIGGMNQFAYTNFQPRYSEPSRDYLARDAVSLGWDGTNLRSIKSQGWVYRNGDFRAHVIAAERLDQVLKEMTAFPDFKSLRSESDLERWVRFKLKFIASFYKEFASQQIIGGNIDVFATSRRLP